MAGRSSVKGEFIAFDDVIIVPGRSSVEPKEVDLTSKVTRNIWVSIPLVSSPMDTVTEWRMAVLLARLGAVGVIHRNMSREEQARQVEKVKSSHPTPWSEVAKTNAGEPLSSIQLRLEEQGLGAAIVFDGNRLKGVYVVSGPRQEFWLAKADSIAKLLLGVKPMPTIDGEGKLRVGAAISPFDLERAKLLESKGVDFLVIDVAHLHNSNAIRALRRLAREVSVDIVAGNLGTREAVLELVSVVDSIAGLRVGISSGSICTTGEVTGAGVPTLTAVIEAFEALEELGLAGEIPIIADGGIRGAGDAAKAIIAGASAVMVGRLLAGAEEAPGATVSIGGKLYKQYRGMASRGSIERGAAADRYLRRSKMIEEGVEGLVPYVGSAAQVLAEFAAGLQAALGYAGASSIPEAWKARLARASYGAAREMKPHSLVLG